MQGIRSIPSYYANKPMQFAEGGLATLPEAPMPPQAAPEMDAVMQQVSANLPENLAEALKQLAQQISTLPPEEIQAFLEALDYLEQNKDRYQEAVQEMVAAGKIPPDSAPPEYNPMLFSAIREIVTASMATPQQPAGFARGGIAQITGNGRFGDNMLAHISPQQAAILRSRGGSGTINPYTGLREYFNLWKAIAPIVGAIAGSFLPFGSMIGPAIGSFAASKLAGNSTQESLMAAALAGAAGLAVGNSAAASAGGYGGSAFSGGEGPSLGSSILSGYEKAGGIGSLFTGAPTTTAPTAQVTTSAPGYLNSSGMGTPPVNSSMNLTGGSPVQLADASTSISGGSMNDATASSAIAENLNSTGAFDATKLLNIPAADLAKMNLTTEELTKLAAHKEALTKLGIPFGAPSQFGFLGDLGKKAVENPMITAMLLSGVSALDQEKMPSGMGSAYGGVTAGDLIAKYPSKYLLNPEAFGIKNSEAIQKYKDAISKEKSGVAQTKTARAGGPINGPGTGTSDSIPARLSDGEFVMTAAAVRGAGGGDRKAGAKKMYQMMHEFEKRA